MFSSLAIFLVILKLQETIPPNALTGSQAKADLKLSILFSMIDAPQGFACLMITVPIFLGKVFDIDKAANISL